MIVKTECQRLLLLQLTKTEISRIEAQHKIVEANNYSTEVKNLLKGFLNRSLEDLQAIQLELEEVKL